MLCISVTLDVSKEDRSTLSRDEHSENMPAMLVTLDVSKPDRSSETSEEHPENM